MYKYIISGTVQGVGFRPFIFRIAKLNNLKGYVKNNGSTVEVVANSPDFEGLMENLPPLASVSSVTKTEYKGTEKFDDFLIKKSSDDYSDFDFPPDIFTCEECIKDMRNLDNRRYDYYFTTCTNCGPRFSMLKSLPYDRDKTTMVDFDMCDKCKKEYTNPMDRRYHAQTIACPNCGPELRLIIKGKIFNPELEIDKIKKLAEIIKAGEWVSVKGVGGYHVMSTLNSKIVQNIRSFFNRPNKPFAVMVKDENMLGKIVDFNSVELDIIRSPARPIVILKKKKSDLLTDVSELDSVGVMFPYTAMHYLLFDYIDEPLLMTSANMPGEPVNLDKGIGDFELMHTREIYNRVDDSVVKVVDDYPLLLRRSRGFVPKPIKVSRRIKPGIALGAEENNTFALGLSNGNSNQVILSQYIGNTQKIAAFEFQKKALRRMVDMTKIKPEFIATDLHPLFNTTKLGEELAKEFNCLNIKVQHHKAHVASVAGEHNLDRYVGIACDGTGYGDDGNVWGGEVFLVENGTFKRVGHLENFPLLGGDSATKNPRKILYGILSKFLDREELVRQNIFSESDALMYFKQLELNFNLVQTSSVGRLLDAVSAMLGVCDYSDYEGRCAMLLENFISENYNYKDIVSPRIEKRKYLDEEIDVLQVSFLFEKYKSVIYERFKNKNKNRIGFDVKQKIVNEFKLYIANGLFTIAKKYDLPVVFSGGVAYNRLITKFMLENRVFINKDVPCGDGGISFGQIVYSSNKFDAF